MSLVHNGIAVTVAYSTPLEKVRVFSKNFNISIGFRMT